MGSKMASPLIPGLGRNAPETGSRDLPALGIAEGLFSRVQLRVLALLFGQPDRDFQGAEIIRMAASGVGAVHRELKRLTASGLIMVTPLGRQKLYRVNMDSPIFEELHGLILKTVGLVSPIRVALGPFEDRIEVAFVYGSTARGNDTTRSDIDLMIIGEKLTYPEIIEAMQPVEEVIKRRVSVMFLTPSEWVKKRSSDNPFLSRVMSQPRLLLIGSENELA
jgi:predicted nucleotidyltransferase